MKEIINKLYAKWVKEKCPHICIVCKYKDTCDYEYKLYKSKYMQGFDDGYNTAEYNYEKIIENMKKKHEAVVKDYERRLHDTYDDGYIDCKRISMFHTY